MDILLSIHSALRWLLAALLLGLLGRLAWLLGRRQAFAKMDRGLLAAFSGLMDTQALLGLLYFFLSGLGGAGFPLYRIEHLTTMFLAVGVSHLPLRWLKKGHPQAVRNSFLAVLVTMALIYAGVVSLPGGWTR